jgi:ABC-type nitrate/sulfonate/bicarbonate transport system substrate-binding protein
MMDDREDPGRRSGPTWRRRELLAAAGVAGLGLLAGCSRPGAAGQSQSAGGPQISTAQVTPVKAGVIAGLTENVFQWLGEERGFFRDEGLDVEFVEFQAGGPMVKALIAGDLDVAEAGFGPVPISVAHGATIKLIGATKPRLNFAIYAREDVNRLEDLYDRTVGIAAPGSFLHQLMVALMDVRGLDAGRLNYVNIGSSPAVFRAVLAGKVDAGPSQIDWVPEANRSQDVKELLFVDEYLPHYFRTGLIARDGDIRDRADLLVGIMTAWARSIRHSVDHPDEWVALAESKTGRPRDELQFVIDWEIEHKIVAPNLTIDPEATRFVQEMNIKAGSQDEALPFERVATNALQQRVVEKLGSYQWKT